MGSSAAAMPTVASERSPALDVLAFAIAAGIVAVHAAVDAFVAPEPGTSWSDHLVRGATTLAVLAVAAALYPRLRDGGRAALALVLGVLALEGFALAVLDARNAGARGEDWTGFLLLPTGAALLGLGAVLLWRSRRPGRYRYLRRAGIALVGLLAAYWLVAPVALAIFATHRPRADVQPADLGRAYEEVTLRTSDGLDLAAWYVPSGNGAAVVSYPTRAGKLPHARMLARNGYGVLLVDARGYDGSEGDSNMFGWNGAKDVDAAVAWLERRPDVEPERIGGIGFSVGGEVMIEAAAGNPALAAIVSEGAGVRSVREGLMRGWRGVLSIPQEAVLTAAVAVLDETGPPPSLEDLAGQISPRAAFFVHARQGGGGEELNPEYFAAAGQPKQLWRIDEGGHVGGLDAQPEEYERRVVGFFDRHLLKG